ncbi:MAG: ABC transporter permease [Candidatus Saccharibacteria bacterium]
MHPRLVLATMIRVLRQLGHDKRTLGLLFIVPCVLLGILAWIYHDTPNAFDAIGAPLLGIFPFVVMFLVTSVAMLRERSSGTLERLLTMPIAKLDILLGYAGAFGLLAIIQASIASLLAVHGYGLHIAGPEWFLIIIALVDALLGTTLGLFTSAFARTEFQAVQFLPALILPQFLLCGLLVPVAALPRALHDVALCLPLTYAVDAMTRITHEATVSATTYHDVCIIVGFAVAAIMLGAATLRRRTS